MWTVIISLLPLVFKALNLIIDKTSENKELREKYVEFLENLHSSNGNPVNAYNEINKQKKELMKEFLDQPRQ